MANDEMQTQTKPRISPLEYRNTDLVSRLLAATPPYLYNMSMIPNTYFFSEMLRSFVQAKAERNTSTIARRSRKRSWTQTTKSEPQPPHKSHKPMEELNWKAESQFYDDNKLAALQQEAANFKEFKDRNSYSILFPPPPPPPPPTQTTASTQSVPPSQSHHAQPQPPPQPQSNESSSNLILPPPPPIWYPPLYNTTPYGIDPLHFFIDLRVSGHIYDRKKSLEKEEAAELLNAPQMNSFPEIPSCKPTMFKSSKHASAFSVPLKHHPINLSKVEDSLEHKPMKFDVKSLGLESTCNKTGTNYVMNNIDRVYKDLHEETGKLESDEEEAKKKKELRELIGLELVVDYMSKKGSGKGFGAGDMDSGSVVEVVDIQEEDPDKD